MQKTSTLLYFRKMFSESGNDREDLMFLWNLGNSFKAVGSIILKEKNQIYEKQCPALQAGRIPSVFLVLVGVLASLWAQFKNLCTVRRFSGGRQQTGNDLLSMRLGDGTTDWDSRCSGQSSQVFDTEWHGKECVLLAAPRFHQEARSLWCGRSTLISSFWEIAKNLITIGCW